MAPGSARKALIAAVLLLVLAPASASAWTVTIHVHGAGGVLETTNRLGGNQAQMNCFVEPNGKSNSSITDCVGGSASGLYNSGNVVRLIPQLSATSTARGWHFDHWTDSSAGGGLINCDPQDTAGDFSSPSYCEFQIFENLRADLWFTDTTGPQDTAITGGPAQSSTTGSTTAQFTSFSAASDPDATFQCRLDPPGNVGTFASCPKNGATFNGLTQNGTWQLTVRAVDPSGNVDTTPAARTWVVDTTPPVVNVTSGPVEGSTTATPTADLGVSTSDGTLVCTIDGATLSSCAPPSVHLSGLGDGHHTFSVRGVDAVGNSSTPITRGWTVDTTPPSPAITGGPAEGAHTTSTTATFGASTNDGSLSCALDGAAVPCGGTLGPLATGAHTFTATATDAASNTASVSRHWTIDAPPAGGGPGGGSVGADLDGDGYSSPLDCNDAQAAIHPGAVDTPGDGIDQDCSGSDARVVVKPVPGRLADRFTVKGAATTVKKLTLSGLPRAAKVVVRCRGRHCPISVASAKAPRSGTVDVRRMLGSTQLRAGQVLTLRISAPGFAARVASLTIRRGKLPRGGSLATAASARPHTLL